MDDMAGFDAFIQTNGISLGLERVASNPILAADSQNEALEHYRCQLLRPGKRLEVYLSARAEDQPLTLFDVLFLLALDASGCRMMAGFETYREKWDQIFGDSSPSQKEVEFFWEELEGRCRQTQALQEFLGTSAYKELLSLLGLEEGHQAVS